LTSVVGEPSNPGSRGGLLSRWAGLGTITSRKGRVPSQPQWGRDRRRRLLRRPSVTLAGQVLDLGPAPLDGGGQGIPQAGLRALRIQQIPLGAIFVDQRSEVRDFRVLLRRGQLLLGHKDLPS